MRKPTVRIYTLGCRLNQLESEAIAEKFEESGFLITDGEADLHIVNSCTVTGKAEQKMRRIARDFSKSGACIVTGCAIKGEKVCDIGRISPGIIAVELERKHMIMDFAAYAADRMLRDPQTDMRDLALEFFENAVAADSDDSSGRHRFDFAPRRFHDHHRAYLKVQDGCDRHCSFCAVSISRGAPASLDSDEAVRRFLALQDEGYKEVCLTGVNLALYDHGGDGLSGLIMKLAKIADGDVRIRLTSLEPDLVDDRLLEVLSSSCICDYFHLPIQSASEKVLALTGRKYDRKALERIILKLREIKGNPFVSADIMTGLPGEGDEEAQITYDFLEGMRLSYLHVFPFSKREGTAAYSMKTAEERVRDERARRLRELSLRMHLDYARGFCGKDVSAIIEAESQECYLATSDNYLKIAVARKDSIELGKRRTIRISEVGTNEKGEPVICGIDCGYDPFQRD